MSSDDQSTTEPSAAASVEAPAATTPEATPEVVEPASVEITPEIQKLIDDAAKAASRDANREAQNTRKRLKELEDADEQRKREAMNETERLTLERDEAKQRAEAAAEATRNAFLARDVTAAAVAKGIDPGIALKLIDNVSFADDGTPEGVAEAVDALAIAYPQLVAKTLPPAGAGPSNGARGGTPPVETQQQKLARHMGFDSGPRASVWD